MLTRPLAVVLGSILGLAARLGDHVVQAGDPKVEVTRFKNVPSKISYFEDTTVSSPILDHTGPRRPRGKADRAPPPRPPLPGRRS